MFDRSECNVEDFDFSEEEDFELNWNDSVNKELANKVVSSGELLGRFDENTITWWSVYKLDGVFYVSMSDFDDVFEVNETILNRM